MGLQRISITCYARIAVRDMNEKHYNTRRTLYALRYGGVWLDCLRHALKVFVVFCILATLAYRGALAWEGHVMVFREMENLKPYVWAFCLIAAFLLLTTGILEQLRRQRKKAAVDFVFAMLALLCLVLEAIITIPRR